MRSAWSVKSMMTNKSRLAAAIALVLTLGNLLFWAYRLMDNYTHGEVVLEAVHCGTMLIFTYISILCLANAMTYTGLKKQMDEIQENIKAISKYEMIRLQQEGEYISKLAQFIADTKASQSQKNMSA